jgi:hypothetical protein
MDKSIFSRRFFLAAVLSVTLFASGCVAPGAALPTPTDLPPPDTPVPSSTPSPIPTDTPTPAPTDTPTPIPTDTPTATLTPTPTQNRTATAEARATQEYERIYAQILEDLEPYELTLDEGYLAWYSKEPEIMYLQDYNVYSYEVIGKNLKLSNFILKTDITWDSKSGLMTCGLIFRSEKNIENGAYYLFETQRLSGLPYWAIEFIQYNRLDHFISGGLRSSPAIDQKAGATNEYIFVIDDTVMTVYANGVRLGTAVSSKLDSGILAFYIYQESGYTTCKFDNTWIWALP